MWSPLLNHRSPMSSVPLYIKKMYILAPSASSFFLVAGVIWPSSGTGCSFPFSLLLLLVGSLELKHEIMVVLCPHVHTRCPELGSHSSGVGRAHTGHGAASWRDCVSRKNTRGGMG